MARVAKVRRRQAARIVQTNGNGADHNGLAPISELIGRGIAGDNQINLIRSRAAVTTVDRTVPDYEFYDRLRRGKAKGYSLGGLFCKRIEQIFAAWVLGDMPVIGLTDADEEDEARIYTNTRLAAFAQDNHSQFMTVMRDMLGLGDQYIIVNGDGTLSVPSPDTVTIKRAERDYRTIEAIIVETRMGKQTIIDEYRADRRTVMVKEGERIVELNTYPNIIGRIPIVHLAHGRSANETNGHPIHEPLLSLFDAYDDVAYKQIDGAKLLGNPFLYFAGMEDINAVVNANDPSTAETYTAPDGSTQTRAQLNIDQNAVFVVGKGGSVGFASPQVGFSADTAQTLKTLFWLLLDHTGIPEFIWGNQVSSGRSSSETQLDQFVRDIESRRAEMEEYLLDLCNIWVAIMAIVDSQLVVDELTATWPPLINEDQEVRLKYVEFAVNNTLLTDKTALGLLDLVDDPEAEIEAAAAQAAERQDAMFPDGTSAQFGARLAVDANETPDEEPEQET
jgi:hypothetical protein